MTHFNYSKVSLSSFLLSMWVETYLVVCAFLLLTFIYHVPSHPASIISACRDRHHTHTHTFARVYVVLGYGYLSPILELRKVQLLLLLIEQLHSVGKDKRKKSSLRGLTPRFAMEFVKGW